MIYDFFRKILCPSDVDRFKKDWRNSNAAKLLLPDIDKAGLELGKQEGNLASIAYLAWMRGHLYRLDAFVRDFEICEKSTDNFKCRLKETWLEKDPLSRRKASHNVISALVELIVADYLKHLCYKITNLEAWDQASCDVEYCDSRARQFKVEVKYIPDSPKWYTQRVKATTINEDDIVSWSDEEVLNYVFYRIAEAILQMKKKEVLKEQRAIWIVFDALAQNISRKIVDCNFYKFTSWAKSGSEYPGIPKFKLEKENKKRNEILSVDPHDWIKNSDRIVFCTFENYQLYYTRSFVGNSSCP